MLRFVSVLFFYYYYIVWILCLCLWQAQSKRQRQYKGGSYWMLISSLLNLASKKLYLLNDRFITFSKHFAYFPHCLLFFICLWCACVRMRRENPSNGNNKHRTHTHTHIERWKERKKYSWHIKIKVFTLFSAHRNMAMAFPFRKGTIYSFIVCLIYGTTTANVALELRKSLIIINLNFLVFPTV